MDPKILALRYLDMAKYVLESLKDNLININIPTFRSGTVNDFLDFCNNSDIEIGNLKYYLDRHHQDEMLDDFRQDIIDITDITTLIRDVLDSDVKSMLMLDLESLQIRLLWAGKYVNEWYQGSSN